MALIDRVKERTGTDLSDTEISAMIAGIQAEIDARYGAAGAVTITIGDPHDVERWRLVVNLPRPMDETEPVEIVEIEPVDQAQASETTLQAADYRVLHGGRTLQRLSGGPNGQTFWAPLVRVTYTPFGQAAARDEVTIKIMQLDLSYRGGLKSERAGDYQFSLGTDPAEERERLLASLGSSRPFNLA